MAITATEKALGEVRRLAAKRRAEGKETAGLRIGMRGGGCTGFSYLFEWSDSEPRPEDKVLSFEEGRVRVFIDPKSFVYLDGSTLEFSTSLMGRGFKFVNPKVKGTCGCGESVSF